MQVFEFHPYGFLGSQSGEAYNEQYRMNCNHAAGTNVAMGGGVPPNLQHSMAAQMGYGDVSAAAGVKQGGLGVQTGLAGLDRILNRDNSALVKKFKK